MVKFSERLKELRLEKGLTQTQLANETGLSQSAVSFWENDERFPLATVVIIFAKYFGVTTDYLLGVTDC